MSLWRDTNRGRHTDRYDNRSDNAASNRYGHNNTGYYNSSTSYRYGGGSDEIEVSDIELFIKYNTQVHHTNDFDITRAGEYGVKDAALVVRRGQEFFIAIKLNRTYEATRDKIRLDFQFGEEPFQSKQSHVELSLPSKSRHDLNNWGTSIYSIQGRLLTISVVAPPTCAVGKWNMRIDEEKSVTNSKPTTIYILFNPWCPGDQVYMKDIQFLKEYIQNASGKVYSGSEEQITHFPWNFGQFSGCVLDCVMYLLDEVSGLSEDQRGDPVHVARRITSMVNSNDDNGVLVGRWQSPYPDGTPPLAWTGSVKILEEYYSTKRPVKYGQCWVFSAIVTTVCRALGIPARSVTNFASAHDTEGNLTIDVYCNSNMDPIQIPGKKQDSIWNFHCWNDVWMARPDLPSGYGGWQAIDATPQERSGKIFCMGPMSLVALKHGHVDLPYDGRFAFAEVNGDRVLWMCTEYDKRKIRVDEHSVGKFISTKRPFAEDRQDITRQYKFGEGTDEEREAVQMAHIQATRNDEHETSQEDVEFNLSADKNTYIGDSFKWMLRVKNKSSRRRTIAGNVRVTSIHYWGRAFQLIVQESLPRTQLEPNEGKSFNWEVPVEKYFEKLTDHCFLRVACKGTVEETDQVFGDTKEVRLRKPHLTLEAPHTGYIGRTFSVRASFRNPLKETLTNCTLRVEGPGKQQPETYEIPNINRAKTFTFDMTPVKDGEKEIVMNFCCDQLLAITASRQIYIK